VSALAGDAAASSTNAAAINAKNADRFSIDFRIYSNTPLAAPELQADILLTPVLRSTMEANPTILKINDFPLHALQTIATVPHRIAGFGAYLRRGA
jgi:hypothetical protein